MLHFAHAGMDPAAIAKRLRQVLFASSKAPSAYAIAIESRRIRTLAPRLRAILPRQMVVLVRIPGCSSFEVFARCFSNSPLMVRSESLVMTVKTALTVCSRTKGATSVNPVT